MSDSLASQIKKIVTYIRKGVPAIKDVIVGPVVRRPEGVPEWYFVFVHEYEGEPHFTSLGADEREWANEFRTKLIKALVAAKFKLHDFDDDLALVQMAEALWPSEKTRRIHAQLVAERAEHLARERSDLGVDAIMKERPLTAAEIVLFGLDAEAATKYFAIDSNSSDAGTTEYYRMVDVDVDGESVPVVQRYSPP